MTATRDPHREHEHQLELEKRALATGAVACAREALRIAAEVDAGRIPRNRAAAVLKGCLGMDDRAAAYLLDSKPEPTNATAPVSEGSLVTAIQQTIALNGPPEEARAMLTKALEGFWAANKTAGTP